MFCLYEKVVYPGHGVAQIHNVVTKVIGGAEATFYELVFLNKDMTILVPTDGAESVGLRALSTPEDIQDMMNTFAMPAKKASDVETVTWNKRNKEYQLKLKRGNLHELTQMYKELHFIAVHKELSFGEKNLLVQIETLLVEEISLVEKMGQEKALEHLRTMCVLPMRKLMAQKMI